MQEWLSNPHAMNKDAINPIRCYCESRGGMCKGCRYSIEKVYKTYQGSAMCIFGNCPMGWKEIPT